MKKTALFYMKYAAPYSGNFILSMRMLMKCLRDKDIDSHCVFPEKAKGYPWISTLIEEGVRVSFAAEKFGGGSGLIKEILKEEKIIFVHTHFATVKDILSIKLAMLASGRKCPVVEHYRNHYVYNNGAVKSLVKRIIMHGDYLVGCSQGVAESLKAGKLKNDIDYVDNAIDFSRLNSSRKRNHGGYDFLQFGFEFERKGVDISLEALSLLKKKYENITLSICLSVNKEYAKERITDRFGKIPDWVKLLPPTNDIAAYYDQASAFLSPSREEGFCCAVVEAAYCKCPVIASDISGQNGIRIPEIIWFRSENPQDLAAKIESFIRLNDDEKSELETNLKESANKYYNLNRWVDQMVEYYEKRKLL